MKIKFFERWPEWLWAVLVFFGFSFSVFARVLLRPSMMIFGSDFLQFYFWEDFVRDELTRGTLPTWNPFLFAGYPALANPQMRVFYPPAMLLRLVPLSYALGLGLALHIGWAGLGMYMLSRANAARRAGAFISGFAFMMCGFIIPHLEAGHLDIIYSVAWLPWIVWCWQRVLGDTRWRWPVLMGLLMTIQFLAGFPSLSLMTAIILGIVTLTTVLPSLLRGKWQTLPLLSVRAAVAVFITLAISAPQLLPAWELVRESSRANGLPPICSQDLTLTLADFATLLFAKNPFETYIGWERVMYVGVLPLLLAIMGMLAGGAWTRWRNTLIAIAVTGAVLGFGPSLPFYSWIPLIGFFRVPAQFIVFICFALAALAGLGVEQVWAWGEQKISYRWLGLTCGLLVLAGIADVIIYRTQKFDGGMLFVIFSILSAFSAPRYLVALGWLWGWNRWWRGGVGITGWVVLVALDLWLFSYPYLPIVPVSNYSITLQMSNMFAPRVVTSPFMQSNRSMGEGVANAQGFAPIVLKSYADFVWGERALQDCPALEHVDINVQDAQLLRMLNVQRIEVAHVGSQEVKDFYPRVAWVGEAVSALTNGAAIKLANPGFDPTKKVIVEGAEAGAMPGSGSARLSQYGTNNLTIVVEATSEGWVYLNDVWYPGWQAWVNGQATPVRRANGTFRAVPVPAGQSTVLMQYESTYLNLGIWIATATWLLLGVIGMLNWRRRRG